MPFHAETHLIKNSASPDFTTTRLYHVTLASLVGSCEMPTTCIKISRDLEGLQSDAINRPTWVRSYEYNYLPISDDVPVRRFSTLPLVDSKDIEMTQNISHSYCFTVVWMKQSGLNKWLDSRVLFLVDEWTEHDRTEVWMDRWECQNYMIISNGYGLSQGHHWGHSISCGLADLILFFYRLCFL